MTTEEQIIIAGQIRYLEKNGLHGLAYLKRKYLLELKIQQKHEEIQQLHRQIRELEAEARGESLEEL